MQNLKTYNNCVPEFYSEKFYYFLLVQSGKLLLLRQFTYCIIAVSYSHYIILLYILEI